ncbi:MAG TPA: hypothetical protein VFF63_04850 [Candidatus Babeliales bacterium]|nr:hypothetical protein [Candidatus Babeliales bacterium]
MEAPTALRPSVRVAVGSLIDYAGLFPPAELPLESARAEYDAARRGPHAWMLGRFIIRAPLLDADPDAVCGPLSVIVDPNAEAFNGIAALRARGAKVEAVEIPLQKSLSPFRERISEYEVLDIAGALEASLVTTGLRDLPAFLEIPRTQPWHDVLVPTMRALARTKLGAKLRCGGLTADAFPGVDEVVAFIVAAHQAGVAFKATAGLHHPVRRRDETTGFTMHGFLNLLAAAALAQRLSPETLAQIVAEEDARAFQFDDESFAWRDESVDLVELVATRRERFVSYGSCSFDEPVADLTTLGLLDAG